MNLCVSDDDVIINIQGIRYVTWGENRSLSYVATAPFYVQISYKGNHQSFGYQTKEKAEAIFNKIRIAMDKSYRGNA